MRFAALDLSEIEPPDIIETLDFEVILVEMVADFKFRFPDYDVEVLESDPIKKAFEVGAMREIGLRARVNGAAKAVMLATSQKNDLGQLAGLYKTKRLVIGTNDDDTPIYENDTDFKRRISLAPEAFSSCGPRGAYLYFALTGDGEDRVATDADAKHIEPGHVTVSIMAGDGEPTNDQVNLVRSYLDGEERLPMTDYVTVSPAQKHEFDVAGTLVIPQGPDATMMRDRSVAGIEAYCENQRHLGGAITISALIHAGFVAGAVQITLSDPIENIPTEFGVFPHVNNINIQVDIR